MAPVRQFAKENKIVTTIAGILAAGLLSWGIWSTTTHFSTKQDVAIHMEKISTLCTDIGEIKTDITDVKKSQIELNSTVLSNQKIIMDDLKALRQKSK